MHFDKIIFHWRASSACLMGKYNAFIDDKLISQGVKISQLLFENENKIKNA